MIFIWTNEGGGPLQYAGLFLFALQFLLPQVMNVYNITMEIEHAHKIPLAAVTCAFLLVVTAIIIWVVFDWEWNNSNENADGSSSNNTTTSSAPAGSATNPVIIDDDENETSTNNNA